MDDLISRLSELRSQYSCFNETERDAYHTLSDAIKELKAQSITLGSISNAYENGYQQGKFEAQQWIPITSRPMDEEERAEWSEKLGYDIEYEEAVIYTSQLPDDGQEVLVCSKYGHIAMDTFYDDECGCYFEDNGDMDGIVAWMPLPEPYKEEK